AKITFPPTYKVKNHKQTSHLIINFSTTLAPKTSTLLPSRELPLTPTEFFISRGPLEDSAGKWRLRPSNVWFTILSLRSLLLTINRFGGCLNRSCASDWTRKKRQVCQD